MQLKYCRHVFCQKEITGLLEKDMYHKTAEYINKFKVLHLPMVSVTTIS